jgi:hypothetical protein
LPNHVMRDRLWESQKLARCSKAAALAYPWIFLVADDHGRFEYHPRRIWTRVFGTRADVSLLEVTKWLTEYERHGLLTRYHVDGGLAYWYNFKGRPPSERRPSEYPDPTGFPPYLREAEGSPTAAVGDSYPLTEQIGSDRKQSRAEQKESSTASSGEQTPDERHAVIDAYNEILPGKRPIGHTPGNLSIAARALKAGYSLEHIRTVLEAVRDRSTDSAAWCNANNRELVYLLRPGPYPHHRTKEPTFGPLDTIPNELATGRRAG